ncbi:MAG: TonB-dependent receptor plug domain-containing protein [Bacteroidota bacterium]
MIRNYQNYILSVIILLFSAVDLFSQDLKIYDSESSTPVENVAIYSEDRTSSAISDAKGIVSLDDFAMSDSVFFQHPSYKPVVYTKRQLKELDFFVYLRRKTIQLEGFVISAYRWEQNVDEIPNQIEALRKPEIILENPQTTADLLESSEKVFVQKSQMGGGSPMIRGFATNSVLLVVDGVRMNNAIYRSGNLHNVISLDAQAIENSEIIFGPGSVTYGSDALGGVMDFHTSTVKLSTSDESNLQVGAMARYSSANNEKTGHFDFNYGTQKWGALTSLTFSDYGHLRMGSEKFSQYKRNEYVKRIQGTDTVVNNSNPDMQIPTAYNQVNLMQKFRVRPSSDFNLVYAFHYSETSDIPRYDRLIQGENEQLKNAEWYYGPQSWKMHHLEGDYKNSTAVYDDIKFSLAYQYYNESRHDRGFKDVWLRHRDEQLDIFNFSLDFDKDVGDNLLYYGVQYDYNTLNSTAHAENIETNDVKSLQTRYPNGDNDYHSMAAYLSYKQKLGENFTVITGLRYSYFDIFSKMDTSAAYYDFPFNRMRLQTGALNGSAGLSYEPSETWRFKINTSSGFHAPNIDDMAKVFDSEPRSVVVPNENLKPEYAYNIDLGIEKEVKDWANLKVTGFYTWVKGKMVRRPSDIAGRDSIMYDGVLSQVHKLVNAENAFIYGMNADFELFVSENFHFSADYSIIHGEDENGDPLRHVAPSFGQAGLRYQDESLSLYTNVKFNGEIPANKLAPSERSKIHMYALDEKNRPYSPEWWTVNIKASWEINENFRISGGLENIMDVRYRTYSSGIAAPGRNFIISVYADF